MNEIRKLEIEISELEDVLLLKRKELANLKKSEQKSTDYNGNGLTNEDIGRYCRQMIIPEIGVKGQLNLRETSFLIVGAGGLGCPALQYLVRAGCLKFGIVDYDTVDINNLHRQILFDSKCLGRKKSECAKSILLEINPNCQIESFTTQITSANAMIIIEKFDVVLDCTDNVATRYLLNDACVLSKKPLVSGSALKMEGQLTVYNYKNGPCYRCIFPKPPSPETVTNCSDGGILGAITGVIGSLQALEAIKISLKLDDTIHGRLLLFDGSRTLFRNIKLRRKDENCSVCSSNPTLTRLIDYEQFCGAKATDKDSGLKLLQNFERISVETLKNLIEQSEHKYLVIDVRSPTEFEFCNLNNSKNIPLKDLIENKYLEEIKDIIQRNNSEVICVCRRGNDSQLAVKHLKKYLPSNHMVRDTIGGLHAWHEKINKKFPKY